MNSLANDNIAKSGGAGRARMPCSSPGQSRRDDCEALSYDYRKHGKRRRAQESTS